MSDKHTVMEQIHAAFQALEFPGEGFLQGIFEGTEPYDEEGPFRGQNQLANPGSHLPGSSCLRPHAGRPLRNWSYVTMNSDLPSELYYYGTKTRVQLGDRVSFKTLSSRSYQTGNRGLYPGPYR